MEMKITRLDEVIGTGLIFDTMMTAHELPWYEDTDITAALLDFEYINNFSGRKIISPAVEKSLGTDGIITAENLTKLCSVAYMMYAKKWARNWAVLTAEYNPIENYSMVEDSKLTRDNKQTHSGTDSTLMTGTDTFVKTGSEADAHTGTITDSATSSEENEVSAFNSSSYEDSNKMTGSGGNTRTFLNTDTTTFNSVTDAETRNKTDATTHGHVIDNDDDERNHLTRSGNIGVTTSQQMIQSDIDLWKWNFFYEVFTDIDNVFTISTY